MRILDGDLLGWVDALVWLERYAARRFVILDDDRDMNQSTWRHPRRWPRPGARAVVLAALVLALLTFAGDLAR